MAVKTHPYSTFLRAPGQVLPDLEDGDVLLERRDEADIVIVRQERYLAAQFGMHTATQVLRNFIKEDPEHTAELVAEQMPWLEWLPAHERLDCVNELLTNLAAGADTGTFEPFSRCVNEWRHTAEVWADPELAERLRSRFRGDGPVLDRPDV